MRKNTMTGQERVRRMFARQDQDSIPRFESFWSDTIRRWQGEGLDRDPNECLGSDFQIVCWSAPSPYERDETPIVEDELTYTFRNEWGEVVREWKDRMGTPEHVSWPAPTREAWFEEVKPRLLAKGPSVSLESSRDALAFGRRCGRWTHLTGLETFEITRHLMGDETTLIAMIDDPEWLVDVSRTVTDLTLRDWDFLWANGVEADGVWVYGDMAYRSGVLCGPPLYRELIWPDHKRQADWAHAHGLPFIFHTDGDVNAVVEDYIAAGFDCLQPLEAKAGMDVRRLCPQYGDRMAFFGNCDVMIYATNDREAIEAEVLSKIEAGKATRGYVYHSDHSVPPSVSWETYRFVIDLVDRYGNYD